jgi:mRNA interferase RelE/StbE
VPGSYEVRFKKSAQKEILGIHQPDLKRLAVKIQALAADPVPPEAVKLVGVPGYRLRQGDWRIVYEFDEAAKVVTIRKVAHRREVYRGL